MSSVCIAVRQHLAGVRRRSRSTPDRPTVGRTEPADRHATIGQHRPRPSRPIVVGRNVATPLVSTTPLPSRRRSNAADHAATPAGAPSSGRADPDPARDRRIIRGDRLTRASRCQTWPRIDRRTALTDPPVPRGGSMYRRMRDTGDPIAQPGQRHRADLSADASGRAKTRAADSSAAEVGVGSPTASDAPAATGPCRARSTRASTSAQHVRRHRSTSPQGRAPSAGSLNVQPERATRGRAPRRDWSR